MFLTTAFQLSLNERQGPSTLLFVPLEVKLNSQRYVEDILESCLLPWANERFPKQAMVAAKGF